MTLEIIAIEDWVLHSGTANATTSRKDYFARLVAAEAAMTDPSRPLITRGHHHYFHGNVRRPDLDAISATRPILIWHRSAHEFALNTPAPELLGVTPEFVAGFSEGAGAQSDFDKRHFFEQGAFAAMPRLAPMLATPVPLMAGLAVTRDQLQRLGITAFLPKHFRLFADDAIFSQLMQMRDGYALASVASATARGSFAGLQLLRPVASEVRPRKPGQPDLD